jgi:hypothetical protein
MWTWFVKNMQIWCMIFSEMAACPSRCFFMFFQQRVFNSNLSHPKSACLWGRMQLFFRSFQCFSQAPTVFSLSGGNPLQGPFICKCSGGHPTKSARSSPSAGACGHFVA